MWYLKEKNKQFFTVSVAPGELFQKLSFGYVCWLLLVKPQRGNFACNYCYRDFCKQHNLISVGVW